MTNTRWQIPVGSKTRKFDRAALNKKQWYKKHGANRPRHSMYQLKIQCQLWSSVFHAGQITRSREELTIGNNMNCNLKDPLEIRGLPKTIGIKHSDLIYNQPEVSLLKYSRSVFHPLWNQSFSSSSFEVLKRFPIAMCWLSVLDDRLVDLLAEAHARRLSIEEMRSVNQEMLTSPFSTPLSICTSIDKWMLTFFWFLFSYASNWQHSPHAPSTREKLSFKEIEEKLVAPSLISPPRRLQRRSEVADWPDFFLKTPTLSCRDI